MTGDLLKSRGNKMLGLLLAYERSVVHKNHSQSKLTESVSTEPHHITLDEGFFRDPLKSASKRYF